MAQERGSAVGSALLLLFLLHFSLALAVREYVVGDEDGWTIGVEGWEKGKHIEAGDVLIFKYSPALHNVVAVTYDADYSGCSVPEGSKVYNSGADKITLKKGDNYFICGIPSHCEGGMKLAVHAT